MHRRSSHLVLLARCAAITLVLAGCNGDVEPGSTPPGAPLLPAALDSTVTIGGIAWDRTGSGPTVVFIHGTNLDRHLWDGVLPSLASSYTLVRYDLRSHGASVDADGPWSELDDLAAVLRAAGVDRATFVGLSAGAGIALEFALAHPERVAGLVLVSPSVRGFVPAPGEVPELFGPLGQALEAGDAQRIGDALLALPTFQVGAPHPALDSMVRRNLRLFSVDPRWAAAPAAPPLSALGEIAIPTTVMVGGADFVAIRSLAQLLVDGIAGASLIRIDDAGHLIPIERPARFDLELARILASTPR